MLRTSSLPYDGAIDADGHINEPADPDEKSVRYMLGANVARVYGLSRARQAGHGRDRT